MQSEEDKSSFPKRILEKDHKIKTIKYTIKMLHHENRDNEMKGLGILKESGSYVGF